MENIFPFKKRHLRQTHLDLAQSTVNCQVKFNANLFPLQFSQHLLNE